MRTALFTDTYLPAVDGVVNSLLTTKAALEDAGHEVLVFAPEDKRNGNHPDHGVIYLPARELPSYPGYRMASLLPTSEAKFLKGYDIDIIHGHGIASMGVKGLWASYDLEIPMVLTFHTMLMDAISYYSPVKLRIGFLESLLRLYLRGFLHKCGGVVAPTPSISAELKALAPRIRRLEVIPTGVDSQRFHPAVDGSLVRERLGLDGEEVILTVGRVSPEKHLDQLFQAFQMVLKLRPDARLLVVGKGPALGHYRRMVRTMGLGDRITFAGFVADDDLPRYYAACDAFAICSTFETQGLVVLEAMATGKPVAGVNFRAIPDFIKEGKTGFLFEPGDVTGCADAIVRALDTNGTIKSKAREVAERFSVERCTGKLVSLYRQLLNGSDS